MNIFIAASVAALLQVVGHYFKWIHWVGKHNLPTLAAYAWGVSAMLIGLALWAALTAEAVSAWQAFIAFTVVAATSGLATLGVYGLDAVGERLHYARTREAMDAVAGDK